MNNRQIGSAWKRSYDQGNKHYLSGSLHLGALGEIPFAMFPNERRDESRQQPTHNIVVTVPDLQAEGGRRRVYMGAAWQRQGRESGAAYYFLKLELDKLGRDAISGVDLAGCSQPLSCRLVAARPSGEQAPDFILYRNDLDEAAHADASVDEGGKDALGDAASPF